MDDKRIRLRHMLEAEQQRYKTHIMFIILYAAAVIFFCVRGTLYYMSEGISRDFYILLVLLCLPACGLCLEAAALVSSRRRIRILSEDRDIRNLCGIQEDEKLTAKRAKRPVSREARNQYVGVLISILFGVLMVSASWIVNEYRASLKKNALKTERESEPSVPILPATDRLIPNGISTTHAFSGAAVTPEDELRHQKAKEWMPGMVIPPQILYEDEQFKLEITGCKVKREDLIIYTRFENHSDHTVTVTHMDKSVYINRLPSSRGIYPGSLVAPGETKEASIYMGSDDMPWYDPVLEELEFRLKFHNEDKEDRHSNQRILLETDPIILRPVPAEGAASESAPADSTVPESVAAEDAALGIFPAVHEGVRVLFENEYVRVCDTGIYETLVTKDGVPTIWSSTDWEILVDNRTMHDIEISGAAYQVNGRNAANPLFDSEDDVWTIPAQLRDDVRFSLYGYIPEEDPEEGSITSAMELMEYLRWPLDKIREGSLTFTLQYTDAEGTVQTVSLKSDFTGLNGDEEDE